MRARLILMPVLLTLTGAALGQATNPPSPPAATTSPNPGSAPAKAATTAADDAKEQAVFDQLVRAKSLISEGQAGQALPVLDQIISQYEVQYPKGDTRWFVVRSTEEAIAYMAMAATDEEKGSDKRTAAALSVWWGEALYLKGFALVDLGRTDEAKAQYERLIELAPYHSLALSELGNIFQTQHNWTKALDYYGRAEAFSTFSPKAARTFEATRALRGQGYVLVELGRLDEAEAKYRECIKLDPNDEKAKAELGYIAQRRATGH